MQSVKDKLLDSTLEVEVTISPDDICAACPHLTDDRCSKKEDSESRISAKDAEVLKRLSLSPGDRMSAGDLFALVAERFHAGISDLCSSCKWYSLGWCEEGIQRSTLNFQHSTSNPD